ncbi:MAG TPA: UDP binding domain-containing protein, partial [Myxococcota bacterium]|nr:UDP binding domain-containing protein [Myxococcota bacterium]
AAKDADALLLITEWNEFRSPDFSTLKSLMRRPILFDGRNIWDPEELRRLGFEYRCIGRP